MVENKFKWTLKASEYQGNLRLQWAGENISSHKNNPPISIHNGLVVIYGNHFPENPAFEHRAHMKINDCKDPNYGIDGKYGHTWDTPFGMGSGYLCAIIGQRGDGTWEYICTIDTVNTKQNQNSDSKEFKWYLKASKYKKAGSHTDYLQLEWDSGPYPELDPKLGPWPRAQNGQIHIYNGSLDNFPENPIASTYSWVWDNVGRNPGFKRGFTWKTEIGWGSGWLCASIALDEYGNPRYICKLTTGETKVVDTIKKEEAMFV